MTLEDFKLRTPEQYKEAQQQAIKNPDLFWAEIANTFEWKSPFKKVLQYNWNDTPSTEWFVGGKLNITENCLDRHVATQPDKLALIWEPNEPHDTPVKLTYKELLEAVCTFANGLKNQGVSKGDRVCIYLPMVPELTIAVLACARIGAIHSVVFAGFSASALAARIQDSGCSILITADGAFRGNKTVPLKDIADDALKTLADERAASTKRFLVNEQGMAADRAVIAQADPAADANRFSGVEMSVDT